MRQPQIRALALLLGAMFALAISISDAAAVAAGACEKEIQSAAAKYQIPEGILYSVGLTETGRKGSREAKPPPRSPV